MRASVRMLLVMLSRLPWLRPAQVWILMHPVKNPDQLDLYIDRLAASFTQPPHPKPRDTLHVIACDKREAFAQGSEATKQSIFTGRNGLLRFARNDGCESGRSLRLLRQWRMRPAEIRRRRILADLDDAAADGAGAGEMLEQRFAVVAADGAGEL